MLWCVFENARAFSLRVENQPQDIVLDQPSLPLISTYNISIFWGYVKRILKLLFIKDLRRWLSQIPLNYTPCNLLGDNKLQTYPLGRWVFECFEKFILTFFEIPVQLP